MVEHEHGKDKMNVKIIGREENNWKRGIKEAIEIKRRKPTLNQDDGRYNLAAIYDIVIDNRNANENRTERSNITTEEGLVATGRN